jgi:hypothetical protein
MPENEIGPLSHTVHKNQLKIVKRPENHKTRKWHKGKKLLDIGL